MIRIYDKYYTKEELTCLYSTLEYGLGQVMSKCKEFNITCRECSIKKVCDDYANCLEYVSKQCEKEGLRT